jgi:hypothetical protein
MATRPQIITETGKYSVEIQDGHGRWYVPAFCDNLESLSQAQVKLAKTLRACELDSTQGRIVEGGAGEVRS